MKRKFVIGLGIFIVLFIGVGLSWKHFSDIQYKKNWVERAVDSKELPTISDDRTYKFAVQTVNAFLNDGEKMEDYIAYLGEKWGLSDVDKLKVLHKAIELLNKAMAK